MTDESMELLSAFIDGEAVDPTELAAALAAPGARELLRDFVLLRAELHDDGERPGAEFYRRMERALEERTVSRPWWRRAIPVPAPALAAATLIGALVVGWVIQQGGTPAEEMPPQPDRLLEFVPGVDWQRQEG